MREDFERQYLQITRGSPSDLLKDENGQYNFVVREYLVREAATLFERNACVGAIKTILDGHCAATGDCSEGCDFVTAWETAIDELRKRPNLKSERGEPR